MDIQSVIDKVKKLLALSQSGNANEAANAAAKANALIDEYRLSVDQLADVNDDPIVQERHDPLLAGERVMTWKKILAMQLAKHYGCFAWQDSTQKGFALLVAGRKSDVAALRYMFAYIASECTRLSVKEASGRGRNYAESYRIGFAKGVADKLAESRKQVAANHDQTAMVKLDARSGEARAAVAQTVKLRSASFGGPRVNNSAYSQGQTAGRSVHMGASLTGGPAKLLES